MSPLSRKPSATAIAALPALILAYGVHECIAGAAEARSGIPPQRADMGSSPSSSSTLDVSLEFASAYVFRGLNVFQSEWQGDQNWALEPRVIWTGADDHWSFGYTAIYQLSGPNLWENVDSGLSSDQIFFADYEFRPAPHLTVTPELAVYVYPEARGFPLIIEPSMEAWYQGPIEAGAFVSHFYAARPGPGTEDYVYVSPQIRKTLAICKQLEIELYVSAGVKLFRTQNGPSGAGDNLIDFLGYEILHYDVTPTVYAELKGAIAWTNLGRRGAPVNGTPVSQGFVDEVAPYWGFTVGAWF